MSRYCSTHLSGDKDLVLKEWFRVLKPAGGLPTPTLLFVATYLPKSRKTWSFGWLRRRRLEQLRILGTSKAGFENIDIEPTRVYSIENARAFLSDQGLKVDALAREVEDKFVSAFVRANKPVTACCTPGCCS